MYPMFPLVPPGSTLAKELPVLFFPFARRDGGGERKEMRPVCSLCPGGHGKVQRKAGLGQPRGVVPRIPSGGLCLGRWASPPPPRPPPTTQALTASPQFPVVPRPSSRKEPDCSGFPGARARTASAEASCDFVPSLLLI